VRGKKSKNKTMATMIDGKVSETASPPVVPTRKIVNMPTTIAAKIEKAEGFKLEGNELVKAGEYAKVSHLCP
jgi:hypothetical protein